jgi:hypothetical protein
MKLALWFATLCLAAGCASSRTQRFLAEHTDGHVFAAPIATVWPAAKQVLTDRGFPPVDGDGPYRLKTAILTPDGNLDKVSNSSAAPAQSSAGTASGRRGSGAGRGGGGLQAPTHSSETWHFAVNGEVIDDSHCRIRFVRYSRSSFDDPEVANDDYELQWALIGKVEPDAAAALRKQAQGEDVILPAPPSAP